MRPVRLSQRPNTCSDVSKWLRRKCNELLFTADVIKDTDETQPDNRLGDDIHLIIHTDHLFQIVVFWAVTPCDVAC
jgi:hypothetical protein